MLSVLDAVAAVARTVDGFDIFVIVENRRISTVAYGVNIDLKAVFIGIDNVLLHCGHHVGARQSGRVGSVEIRLKKPSGGRTEAAVGVTLKTSDPQHRRAER